MAKPKVSVHWFRRDLRLEDNTALSQALKGSTPVVPLFVFDTDILSKLERKDDRRVDFIHQALTNLNDILRSHGSTLHIEYSTALQAFELLFRIYDIESVYTNHDYEPAAIERDRQVANYLMSKGCAFKSFKDQVIFEKTDIVKDDGKPYTVFTPYSNKWKKTLRESHYTARNCSTNYQSLFQCAPREMPSLKALGFAKTSLTFSFPKLNDELLIRYKAQRDFPAIAGTSRMSMHLRFGTVSIRELVRFSMPLSEAWLNELIWREFYMQILWHFPHVVHSAFKPHYNQIIWRNNEAEFQKWCEGKTGFPIVDAGMRELNATGFMHNRVRMIVSSFLVKDLLIDWRWGEAYFAAHLNDFDLSANNGGWQWAAGSGCDAAPYFRVFNPTEQQKKFDPEFLYIKKWVPEFGTESYPTPMVDHASARLRVLNLYKTALSEHTQLHLF